MVLSALLFGALTQGGKLMGIDTGIPVDLLLFIMALVIMFVAAPGLIRSIWRVRVTEPAPEIASVSSESGGHAVTAAAATVGPPREGSPREGPSGTRGCARSRSACSPSSRPTSRAAASTSLPTFSFWIDKQGGQTATLTTTVGAMWVVAAVAHGARRRPAAARRRRSDGGRGFSSRSHRGSPRCSANLLAGKPAVMTNVFAGSLELAAPISMAAMAGILSERSGMLNIALEGKMLVGACVASIVGSIVSLATGNAVLAVLIAIVAAPCSWRRCSACSWPGWASATRSTRSSPGP